MLNIVLTNDKYFDCSFSWAMLILNFTCVNSCVRFVNLYKKGNSYVESYP